MGFTPRQSGSGATRPLPNYVSCAVSLQQTTSEPVLYFKHVDVHKMKDVIPILPAQVKRTTGVGPRPAERTRREPGPGIRSRGSQRSPHELQRVESYHRS